MACLSPPDPGSDLPPSADGSFVPCTQSPAQSPGDSPDSKGGSPAGSKSGSLSPSEQLDSDRAVVPETLAWDAACSQWAAADGTAGLQTTAGDHAHVCSPKAVEERQPSSRLQKLSAHCRAVRNPCLASQRSSASPSAASCPLQTAGVVPTLDAWSSTSILLYSAYLVRSMGSPCTTQEVRSMI